jgi:hypothetical protein
MNEVDDATAFARFNKNRMALVKACELRARLSGPLIYRVEIIQVDLRSALEAVEARVITVTPLPLPYRGVDRLEAPHTWQPVADLGNRACGWSSQKFR